ncbi:MAG: hypothetical protein COB46_09675 [Rhodospirillaceae bacterium]|nr:MAG: hypothetical protein COB46_09675 [Rhodospirillaceae bacterium]
MTECRETLQIDDGLFLDALNSMEEAFVIYCAEGFLVFCNQKFRDMYDYSVAETKPGVHFKGLGKIDVIKGHVAIEDEGGRDYLVRKMDYRKKLSGSFTVKLEDGRWIRTTDRRMANGGFVSIQIDVTEIKELEAMRHMANHDDLTGLPTRRLAKEKVHDALLLANRHKWKVALMFVDLDDFKAVNDTLGHDAGDTVLQQVAQRFSLCLRETDTVARVGGDEFLVIESEVLSDKDVSTVAENLIKSVSKPFYVDGEVCHIGASIGISLYPDQGTDCDTLLKKADLAMYKAKKSGKNRYAFALGENPL